MCNTLNENSQYFTVFHKVNLTSSHEFRNECFKTPLQNFDLQVTTCCKKHGQHNTKGDLGRNLESRGL